MINSAEPKLFSLYLATYHKAQTVVAVLLEVETAVLHACAAVGLTEPRATVLDSNQHALTAIVPMQDATRCLYISVSSSNPEALPAAIGVNQDDISPADVLAEMANLVAGVMAAGSDLTIGLPLVFAGDTLSSPPRISETSFLSQDVSFTVSILG